MDGGDRVAGKGGIEARFTIIETKFSSLELAIRVNHTKTFVYEILLSSEISVFALSVQFLVGAVLTNATYVQE